MIKVIAVFLSLFFITTVFSEEKKYPEPEYSENSLNQNLIIHGWKIEDIKSYKHSDYIIEIFTLNFDRNKFIKEPPHDWILKCNVSYSYDFIEDTTCQLP